METSALKDLLIQRIRLTNDELFLNALKVITDTRVVNNSECELNEFEQQKIAKARKQIAQGKSVTQEEVFEKVDAWLKEE